VLVSCTRTTVAAVIGMLVLLLAAGCVARGGGVSFDRPEVDDLPDAVKAWFEEHAKEKGTFTKDAGGRTYILVAWGEKPTAGYEVRVRDVAEGSRGPVVTVELKAPEPGQPEVITYPRDLVSIPRTDRDVSFAYVGKVTLETPERALGVLTSPPEKPSDEPPSPPEEPVAQSENFRLFEPAPGSTVSKPLRVRGVARVFEGTFILELEDGHNVLVREVVQAQGGGPEWGKFDVSLDFETPTSPNGTLIFVTESAKDGSRKEEMYVPLSFEKWE